MGLLASSYDQSKYFKAADFEPNEERKFKIKAATEETVGAGQNQERKLIVWFTNTDKGLVLNKTNNRTLRGAFGDAVDGWADKIIMLFRTEAEMRGSMVPALRVRIPPPKQATVGNGGKPKGAAEALDTFAQGTQAQQPQRPLKDDLDDEIAF